MSIEELNLAELQDGQVFDLSGKIGNHSANYRLTVWPQEVLQIPEEFSHIDPAWARKSEHPICDLEVLNPDGTLESRDVVWLEGTQLTEVGEPDVANRILPGVVKLGQEVIIQRRNCDPTGRFPLLNKVLDIYVFPAES